jgi:hypothetical protein
MYIWLLLILVGIIVAVTVSRFLGLVLLVIGIVMLVLDVARANRGRGL